MIEKINDDHLRVIIPEKVSTNPYYRMHYSKRTPLHEVYYYAAAEAVDDIDFEIAEYPVIIKYTFAFKGKLLDSSNLSAMVKMIEDGFVHAGLMPDDSNKYVKYTMQGCRKTKKDEEPHCIVEIFTGNAQLVEPHQIQKG
jgi:hypothetical protein